MANTFGQLFRVTTFGESHGGAVGVIVDGCPPQIELDVGAIQGWLDRRRPGQSELVTQRKESDSVEVVSGVFEGKTLGTPIALIVRNSDARPAAYEQNRDKYRPSHADFTYEEKYGTRNWQGGGRASARETIGRVAAAGVALQVLQKSFPEIKIFSWVQSVHDVVSDLSAEEVDFSQIEKNIMRAADPEKIEAMIEKVKVARNDGDSVGGVVACRALGVPSGWGEPVFDKLEADLAKAMMSLPASKGFEIGSGFAGTGMFGSEHNDEFFPGEGGRIATRTNRSGGVQGGISNGMPIDFRVAFKPTATILKEQKTVDRDGVATTLMMGGRHDPCVLPRAVPIVEAMTALVLCDHFLRQRAIAGE